MALDPVVNFFRSTIATLPLNSGTTTMVLASGDGNKLPDPSVDGAFNLVVYDPSDPFVAPEIVRCTARTSDTLTISRGQEGTSDATKAAGIAWTVELVPTAKTIQDIDSTKVNVADIVSNLTSTDTNKPLSANQGKVLQDGKVAKAGDTMTGTLTATKLIPSGNVTAGNGMYLPATNTLAFSTNGNERVRFDSSGNVGIGVTPFAWGSNYNSIDIAPASSISGTKNVPSTIIATNGFFDGSVFKYKSSNPASAINQFDGGHSFFTAPSGTAGNTITFTERMTITSAGDVGIGNTAPASKLHVTGLTRSTSGINFNASGGNTLSSYEEGTFNFGIAFGGSDTGITYSSRQGKYTRIGRQVTVTGLIFLTNKGAQTGNATITGLPFTIFDNDANTASACFGSVTAITFADIITGVGLRNTTTIVLQETTNAGVRTALTDADFANNSILPVSMTYFTS
jgi:hypothetical protein